MLGYHLLQGSEKSEKIDLLLELTSITSESLRKALHIHLTRGDAVQMVCLAYDLKQQNFSRGLKRLNEVNFVYEKLKALEHHNSDVTDNIT